MKVYVNGKILPENMAVIRFDDHGFLYGDGVYETLRIYKGRAFKLREHLKRLRISARGIALRVPLTDAAFDRAVHATVRANKLTEAVVRLTLSRGPGPYGFDIRPCKKPTLVITAMPFTPYPAFFHRDGITLGVAEVIRNNPRSLPPWVKSTNCLNGIFAKMQSLRLGAQEGMMIDYDGNVSEGTVSNVFMVKKSILMTPALTGRLLSGVTRLHVIALAKKLKIRVQEKAIPLTQLKAADEIFVTNTTFEVLPVRRLVSKSFSIRKKKGPLTTLLLTAFRDSVVRAEKRAPSTWRGSLVIRSRREPVN